MKTDYKFWYITRGDDVHISEAAVRFSEGDITTEDERNIVTLVLEPVTRYRRTKTLTKIDAPHLQERKTKTDTAGTDFFIYTAADFGVISEDNELRAFLNGEMKLDLTRDNIDEQVEEDLVKLNAIGL